MKEKIILVGIGLILLFQLVIMINQHNSKANIERLNLRIDQISDTVTYTGYDIENSLYSLQDSIYEEMANYNEELTKYNSYITTLQENVEDVTDEENLDLAPVVEDLLLNPEENITVDISTYLEKNQPYLKFQVTFSGELDALITNPKIKLLNESSGSYILNALEQEGNTYACSFKLLKDTSYSYSVLGVIRNKTLNTELKSVNPVYLYQYENFTYEANLYDSQLSILLGLETSPPALEALRVQNMTFKILDENNNLLDTLDMDSLCKERFDMAYKEIPIEKLLVLIAAGEFKFDQDINHMKVVPGKIEIIITYGTDDVITKKIDIKQID
ncbi:hypothetical protein [Vallitalea okinawensis]|uniref:hypothetical protein n=1 Tax=Vallitalea okinawensis TaxID=2078660 RepID=UPI000CFDD8A2|nr:hypothetical protein [Vallitalea okinawensis]